MTSGASLPVNTHISLTSSIMMSSWHYLHSITPPSSSISHPSFQNGSIHYSNNTKDTEYTNNTEYTGRSGLTGNSSLDHVSLMKNHCWTALYIDRYVTPVWYVIGKQRYYVIIFTLFESLLTLLII